MTTARASYIPGLDGVRGLAIVAVIIAHVFERVPPGQGADTVVYRLGNTGWIGVDLFFVLSGFLITGILIDERGRERYFRTFYARRVLRIVPVYVVFLLFSMWIAPLVGVTTPAVAQELRATQGWYWAYLSNVYDSMHPFPAEGIPSHLWSLAVEEQFYLLWPLTVAFASPRKLPRVAIGCVVAAELFRIAAMLAGAQEQAIYHLLPTRMDTLAVGAFLACAIRDPDFARNAARWRAMALGGAILLLGVPLLLHRTAGSLLPVTQLFGLPAIAIVSGLLVLLVVQSRTLLTNRPLRFLGRYSYGMYIWHFLVLHVILERTSVFVPWRVGGSYFLYYAEAVAAVLAATILVALVSWIAIERPFLLLKRFVPYASPNHPAQLGTARSSTAPSASTRT
ncbi:MAG: acyltransferase [Gemmatimonadetes bacterium]|nr:acyltransferase [Gemmatimonadota bacterium]